MDRSNEALLSFMNQNEVSTQTDTIINSSYTNNTCSCFSCGKPLLDSRNSVELRCQHKFCEDCLRYLLKSQIDNESNTILRCPQCMIDLNDDDIRKVEPKFTQILHHRFLKSLGSEVSSCPRCKTDFIIDPGKFDPKTVDKKGEKYRQEAIECHCKYRVTCPVEECRTCFCAKCKYIPYHDEITCEEQRDLDNDIFCRYCTIYPPIGGDSKPADQRVCWHQECRENIPESCMHVCDCGHACCGIKNETEHFGCALCQMERLNCTICMRSCTEKPSVVLKCGHPVHKSCLIDTFKAIDLKDKIKIPRCRICNNSLYHDCVKDESQKWQVIENKIKEMIDIRMKIEDTQNEEDHVKNPACVDYYNQPLKFAWDYFVFYFCEKCHEPYYAGHKNCGNNEDGEEVEVHNPADDGPHECLRCNRKLISSICPKHGESAMVFKCMFCCSPSIWLCYNNTTYFCDPCHRRAGQVEHDPSYPACDGHCKFAPHPPNGQRVISGFCVLCEQEKENQMIH